MKQLLSKRGFTMIEILIALAIISVLFVIMIPQVNGYFNKSKEAGVRSVFRDFQTSSRPYLSDSFGKNLDNDSLNLYLDPKYETLENEGLFETKTKDPWGNPYEIKFGNQKITFISYGKDRGNNEIYTLSSYYHKGMVDFCTTGFSTNNIEFTSIKDIPANFTCGENITASVTPPNSSIETPKNFTAINVTQTTAELSWSSLSNATSYILKRDGVVIYSGNNTTYSDISLTPSATYKYELAAKNTTEMSLYVPLNVTTDSPSAPLTAPLNFNAANITATTVDLSWDSVSGAIEYILKRDEMVIYTGNSTTFKGVDLTAETNYLYSVAAKNNSHTSPYSQLTVTTKSPPPPPPTSFRTVDVTDSTISLVWFSVPNANSYTLKRNGLTIYTGNNTNYIDSGLIQDTTYNYSIIANSMNGMSEPKTLTAKTLPIEVSVLITEYSAGDNYTLSLKNNGTLWAWGHNYFGYLGDGTISERETPVQVKNLTNVTSISAGYSHSVALKNDGIVWAWGANGSGQLGDGTTTQRLSPVQVQNLTDVKNISAGDNHSLALKNDGTVWGWGFNYNSQLGDGTATNKSAPVQMKNLINVANISAGYSHSVALKNDGTVWSSGLNNYGQLGDNSTTTRNVPVQAKSLTNVKSISAGYSHSVALKNDGTVWAWGRNTEGQLGDGTTTNRSTPVQVKNLTNVKSISARMYHTIALKNDGTVWAWGNNSSGQLGDGTTTSQTTPIQVKNLTNVKSISAGMHHIIVLKNDGTAWAWGSNAYGQLGDGTKTNQYTPVQVKE